MASLSISKAWDESKAILAHDGRLIASVALEHSEVLITRNRKHFARIAGLNVETY